VWIQRARHIAPASVARRTNDEPPTAVSDSLGPCLRAGPGLDFRDDGWGPGSSRPPASGAGAQPPRRRAERQAGRAVR
jgi:hypothetical protein